jgi:F0F1-type ATP synthase assembly protein I
LTIHFGTGWLIGLCIAGYLIGVILGNLLVALFYMDGAPPWYMKIMPLFWPVALPLYILYTITRILFMPFFGD